MTSYFEKLKYNWHTNTYLVFMSSNTLHHVAQKGRGQKIVEATATKFSEKFAISMHRKFCRRGLTHLNATPTFKNRLETVSKGLLVLLKA